ncbi:hypothetical protein HDU96_004072 [Phlyctochytrium bullatum]|nr:hypothetical protein HDU96_004072 [Phlyctochytrium bullatum]
MSEHKKQRLIFTSLLAFHVIFGGAVCGLLGADSGYIGLGVHGFFLITAQASGFLGMQLKMQGFIVTYAILSVLWLVYSLLQEMLILRVFSLPFLTGDTKKMMLGAKVATYHAALEANDGKAGSEPLFYTLYLAFLGANMLGLAVGIVAAVFLKNLADDVPRTGARQRSLALDEFSASSPKAGHMDNGRPSMSRDWEQPGGKGDTLVRTWEQFGATPSSTAPGTVDRTNGGGWNDRQGDSMYYDDGAAPRGYGPAVGGGTGGRGGQGRDGYEGQGYAYQGSVAASVGGQDEWRRGGGGGTYGRGGDGYARGDGQQWGGATGRQGGGDMGTWGRDDDRGWGGDNNGRGYYGGGAAAGAAANPYASDRGYAGAGAGAARNNANNAPAAGAGAAASSPTAYPAANGSGEPSPQHQTLHSIYNAYGASPSNPRPELRDDGNEYGPPSGRFVVGGDLGITATVDSTAGDFQAMQREAQLMQKGGAAAGPAAAAGGKKPKEPKVRCRTCGEKMALSASATHVCPGSPTEVMAPAILGGGGSAPAGGKVRAGMKLRVVKRYNPMLDDELRLEVDEWVKVEETFEDGWGNGTNISTGEYGAFPLSCLGAGNASRTGGTAKRVQSIYGPVNNTGDRR